MPNPTNPNAPKTLDYNILRQENTKNAAGFRPSITFAAALLKLEFQPHRDRLQRLTQKQPKGKMFNSNPWTAYSSGKKGKEFDLDGGVIWRAIRHNGYWFLAHHVGANNGFEFWHISDWPSKAPRLQSSLDNSGTVQTPGGTPVMTQTELSHSSSDEQGMVPVLATPTSLPTYELPDFSGAENWEEAAEMLEHL